MRIIKLNAIDSTNTYLRGLSSDNILEDYTVVSAERQTGGRGQMGAVWSSESSKNLTFSVFKKLEGFNLEDLFYVSIVTSLAVYKTLQIFSIKKTAIKWPNDILSENKKVCGILIENIIKNREIKGVIIGIGLNVNQIMFNGLPKASSLKNISGKLYDLDEVLDEILKHLKAYFLILKAEKYDDLKAEYESCLFRNNKPSTFKNTEGLLFSGFIKGISKSGNLQVLLEDNIIKEFNLKTITLLY